MNRESEIRILLLKAKAASNCYLEALQKQAIILKVFQEAYSHPPGGQMSAIIGLDRIDKTGRRVGTTRK